MGGDEMTSEADRAHLGTLFEREADRIYGYLLARVGSRAQAEDLVADVFVQAARRCAQGRRTEVTGAWLQAVASRRLIDHWRRSSTRQNLERALRREAVPGPETADGDGRVLEALSTMPDRQRAALALRYLDEFSVSEVADTLAIPYTAAESLLARARRSFTRAFEELS